MSTLTFNKEEFKASDKKSLLYLPGLNGLRAIAALAVVISHITLGLDAFGLDNTILNTDSSGKAKGLSLAANGVTIFFNLSGFLITYLLLKEKEKNEISISKFYMRRALRIWPLYYLYFFCALIVLWAYDLSYVSSSIPFYIFLAANIPLIIGKSIPLLTHYWSLGVEEQFYLFFPHLAKLNFQRFYKGVALLFVVLLVVRFLSWMAFVKYDYELLYRITGIIRFHCMLIGAGAAILYYERNQLFYSISTAKISQFISWGIIVLILFNKFKVPSVIEAEVVSVVTVILIMGQVTGRNKVVSLENRPCDLIGKISYGIYVIHPVLILLFSRIIGKVQNHSVIAYIGVYSLIMSSTLLLAYISYEYFEKWFLMIKRKYEVVKSSNTKSANIG